MAQLIKLAFAWLLAFVGSIHVESYQKIRKTFDIDPTDLPEGCEKERQLVLRHAFYSNLGNHGPDFGAPSAIMYGDVFPFSGKTIDLEVKNMTDYSAKKTQGNGIMGAYGSIHIENSDDTPEGYLLRFRFYERNTSATTVMPSFLMSVFAAIYEDEDETPGGFEFAVPNFTAYYFSDNTSISVVDGERFTVPVTMRDTAKSAAHLNSTEISEGVALLLPATSEFYVAFRLTAGTPERSLIFSGESNLVCPDRASCDSLECPSGMKHVEHAVFYMCKRSVCTVELDQGICCKPVQEEVCKNQGLMYLQPDAVRYSNLGGLGPDTEMPAGILLGDVFPFSGTTVDLFITNTSRYDTSNTSLNAMSGSFGNIHLSGPDTVVGLKFTFVNRTANELKGVTTPTGSPLTLTWPFFAIFYDLTEGSSGSCKMSVRSTSATSSRLTSTTGLAVQPDGFIGPTRPDLDSGPRGDLGPQSSTDFAVGYTFGPGSSFYVELKLESCDSGKHFYWTGQPAVPDGATAASAGEDLVCPARATCSSLSCPSTHLHKVFANMTFCQSATCSDLDIETCCYIPMSAAQESTCMRNKWTVLLKEVSYSNLGGLGPDFHMPKGLLFADVFPFSGHTVDLLITNTSAYEEPNTDMCGLNGMFGNINIQATTGTTFRWRFIDRRTSRPITPATPFLLTFFDFDQMKRDRCLEQLTISNVLNYTLSPDTIVGVLSDSSPNTPTFTSTEAGTDDDNPYNPMLLSQAQKRKAVTVTMAQVSEFWTEFYITKGWGNRNFLFQGVSNAECFVRPGCDTYTCPEGYATAPNASEVMCMEEECSILDLPTCCVETVSTSCSADEELRLSGDQLNYSNLGAQRSDTASGIRFSNVFPAGSQSADLVVENTSAYVPGGGGAVYGNFGVLSLSGAANFTFKFVARGTDTPVTVAPYYLTFANLGLSAEGGTAVRLKVATTFLSYQLASSEYLQRVGEVFSVQEAAPVMASTPTDPLTMSTEEAAYAVSFWMPEGNHFRVEIDVGQGPPRDIMFAGSSTLVCPGRATCENYTCPAEMYAREQPAQLRCSSSICTDEDCCSEAEEVPQPEPVPEPAEVPEVQPVEVPQPEPVPEPAEVPEPQPVEAPEPAEVPADVPEPTASEPEQTTMDTVCQDTVRLNFSTSKVLYSNLGGLGPDLDQEAKLVFGDVFPSYGSVVNMEVTNDTLYGTDDPCVNGLNGSYGILRVLTENPLTLRFKFVDGDTGESVRMPELYFSMLELQSEKFGCRCGIDYTLNNNTRLQVFDTRAVALTRLARWRGTSLDRRAGRYLEPQPGRRLGFAVPTTDQFVLEVGALPSCHSRNLLFAGISDEQCQL